MSGPEWIREPERPPSLDDVTYERRAMVERRGRRRYELGETTVMHGNLEVFAALEDDDWTVLLSVQAPHSTWLLGGERMGVSLSDEETRDLIAALGESLNEVRFRRASPR